MNGIRGTCCFVLLLLFCHSPLLRAVETPENPENLHIILLVGQSNMAGRGMVAAEDREPHPRVLMFTKEQSWQPAVDPLHFDKPKIVGVGPGRSFGIAYAEANPGVTVGLVPCAVGGSAITSWVPGGYHEQTKSHPWDDMLPRAKAALRAGRLKAILWHQGEADCNPAAAPAYAERLRELVGRFRKSLDAPAVPFLVGQLGIFPARPWTVATRQVDRAHRQLPTQLPAVGFVSAEGLTDKGDALHFDAASYRALGRRYFTTFQWLSGQAAGTTPAATDSSQRSAPESAFTSLCDGTSLRGWEQAGNWEIKDGVFHRVRGGGPLTYTAAPVPDDFELRFDWKVSAGCNSGVYYRPGQVEYQVLDNAGSPYGENPRQAAASLFFCMAPETDLTRPAGEWNTGRIICKGSLIEHWLNGEPVISFDYQDPRWAVFVDLLAIRGGNLTGRGGRLWLQDHGHEVWYRRLRWRTIPAAEPLAPNRFFQPEPVTGAALAAEEERVRKMLEKSAGERLPAR